MGKIRENLLFKKGFFSPVSSMLGCVAFRRHDENGNIMVIVNRNEHPISYRLPDYFNNSYALYGNNPETAVVDRLEYELKTINKMGYVDYYLIVSCIISLKQI